MLWAVVLFLVVPLGLDLYLPAPASNPMTPEQIERGRQLFFDRRLSFDESISCATCHRPDRAFSSAAPIAIGVAGRTGTRNAPALINRGYGRAFFWDGRTATLEEQVLKPIEDRNEMGSSIVAAAARVGVAPDDLARSLASFVRSILSGNSRFDRFADGDRMALTDVEVQGLQIFRTRGRCTMCHIGPNFTDERFHNTGVAWAPPQPGDGRPAYRDDGRFLVTGHETDRGAFKTPTLRDVSLTSPYMHDGSLPTLEAVVEFYDQGGRTNPNLDPAIRPLKLSAEDRRALVAFLGTLTGHN